MFGMSAAHHRLECSLDRNAVIISAVVWLTPLVFVLTLLLIPPQRFKLIVWAIWVVSVLPAVLVALLQPRGYLLDETGLTIKRWIGAIHVERSEISKIDDFRSSDAGSVIRTFGSGGAHGYFGYFRSSVMGTLMYQATRRDTLLILTRKSDVPVVLSPDDPAMFRQRWSESFP